MSLPFFGATLWCLQFCENFQCVDLTFCTRVEGVVELLQRPFVAMDAPVPGRFPCCYGATSPAFRSSVQTKNQNNIVRIADTVQVSRGGRGATADLESGENQLPGKDVIRGGQRGADISWRKGVGEGVRVAPDEIQGPQKHCQAD